MKKLTLLTLVSLSFGASTFAEESFRLGSKTFTESYILGELLAQKIEREFPQVRIDRRLGMGGTGILFEALRTGNLDFYPEYTGTIAEAILKQPDLKSWDEINESLREIGLQMSRPLGFNNTYAIAVTRELAEDRGLTQISDLVDHPDLEAGVSYEFLDRADGYYALANRYGFENSVRGMEHSLAYEALDSGAIDFMDVYTTDAKLGALDLVVLEDDLSFFPRYDAVVLARLDFVGNNPEIWKSIMEVSGEIDESLMSDLNARVDLKKQSISQAASAFFEEEAELVVMKRNVFWSELALRSQEHIFLVLLAMLAAILIGVPLGFMANYSASMAHIVMSTTGLVQTLPSLALLGFLIPLFGIGTLPALVAIFLYSLLPIVRSTHLSLSTLDASLRENCEILGLSSWQKISWIELPLVSLGILSGVKTSAVISVGTATLAAFIGAGGYGDFILRGIAINDSWTILHGAVPAALMALVIQWLFDLVERVAVPEGLRLSSKPQPRSK